MADLPNAVTNEKDEQASVTISYIQPADLRTTYLSGAVSTTNSEGLIHVMGFVERKTYPSKLIVSREPDETGSRLREVGPYNWVREIQISVLLDKDAVEDLISVLQQSLKDITEDHDETDDEENEQDQDSD